MIYLLATTAALALSVVLGESQGLYGVALALLLIDVLMSLPVLRRSMELTQDRPSDFVRWIVVSPRRSIGVVLRRTL